MDINQLAAYLDDFLGVNEIKDYGPQGLQVEIPGIDVTRVGLAVDISPTVVEAAADWGAQLLLVHHGILWGDAQRIAGGLGARVRGLVKNDISLYAAHLALDAHPEVGNNAVLARTLGIEISDWWAEYEGVNIGCFGTLATPSPISSLVELLDRQLPTRCRVLAHGPEMAHRVACISGFGADKIAAAAALGADTFVTGETSHENYWAAKDNKINVIFGGHYATETVGVKEVGRHLEEQLGLETRFLEFPTEM